MKPLILEIREVAAAVRTNFLPADQSASRMEAVEQRVVLALEIMASLAAELRRLPCRSTPCPRCAALAAYDGYLKENGK